MSIFHEAELINSKSETLSESCCETERTGFNCSEGASEENMDHVKDTVNSKTVSSVAPISAPQEVNVLDSTLLQGG